MVFKVKINPVNLPVGWNTATNYTFSITEGFVKQIDGNKSPSPVQTITNAITTFASVPPTNLYAPPYNSITRYPVVTLNYDREILYNSTNTTNYYLYQGNTLTQTIASTSTRISKTTGTVKINLFGLINTSTSYNLRADQGVFRDMFSLKSNSIENDSVVKFTMSSTYISLAPFKEIETEVPVNDFRGITMATAIGTNLMAVGVNTAPYPETTATIQSNIKIYNTSGNFLYQINNPLTHSFTFGSSNSISMSDTKLIAVCDQKNANVGKIVIYNLTTSSASSATTITLNVDTLRSVDYNGSSFITTSRQLSPSPNVGLPYWFIYSDTGTLIRGHDIETYSSGPTNSGQTGGRSIAINSTLYAYHEVKDTGHVVFVRNISNGNKVYTLTFPDINKFDNGERFTLAMDDTYLMVSDYKSFVCNIYNLSTGNLVYTLTSPDTNRIRFGVYAGLNENYFMIVDPEYSETVNYPEGKIYLFSKTTGVLVKTIDNPYFWDPAFNPSNNAYEFGVSASIKNNILISTVPAKEFLGNTAGEKPGTAYFYNVN